jgi:hypothetical protein
MASVKLNVSLDRRAAQILRDHATEIGVPASRYLSELVLEDDRRRKDRLADEGYRALSEDARQFAAAALPVAAETWPDWQVGEHDDEQRAPQG